MCCRKRSFYCPCLKSSGFPKHRKHFPSPKLTSRNYKEFSVQRIWNSLQRMANKDTVLKYFPQFTKSKLPNKKYMINVINTLTPGIIHKTIQDIKNKRVKK